MSETYKPDDKPLQPENARARVKAAIERLKEGGRRDRVVTSRDEGMNDALLEGKRKGFPDGVEQWQLPIELGGPVFFYLTVVQPGAVVGTHSHDRALFRVIISGSIILEDGSELKSGDWMYVPPKVRYSFRGGLNPGAIIYHCYGLPPTGP